MGYRSLPNIRVVEPTLSANAFPRRCLQLAGKFGELLDQDRGNIAFFPEISDSAAFVVLGGRGSEVIDRNVGPQHRVIKLCALSKDVFAWAGFRERWHRTEKERNFRFESAGFTFHAGREGELWKPQIMRSEWVSQRSNEFRTSVGHPHWQIDVLDSIRLRTPEEPNPFTNGSGNSNLRQFEIGDGNEQMFLSFCKMPMERMHLASVAPWWNLPNAKIAYSPRNEAELNHWIIGCISYVRQELMRCEFR